MIMLTDHRRRTERKLGLQPWDPLPLNPPKHALHTNSNDFAHKLSAAKPSKSEKTISKSLKSILFSKFSFNETYNLRKAHGINGSFASKSFHDVWKHQVTNDGRNKCNRHHESCLTQCQWTAGKCRVIFLQINEVHCGPSIHCSERCCQKMSWKIFSFNKNNELTGIHQNLTANHG